MHTILGAGGPTANALTQELLNAKQTIRLVSRRPSRITDQNISWEKADLQNYHEVLAASRGSKVIYLCAGLPYDKNIWKQQWPVIMENVINVAKETQARLIFFDNVYMYGLVDGPMLESTSYNPCSVKGEVRARIATQLMEEAKAGNINASIARSADFYGTDSGNSLPDTMVLSKYAKGQSASWVGSSDTIHNFTYIPDAGKGLYLLGQHPENDNQIWHIPTAAPIPGKEFIELAAKIYQVKPKFMHINKFILQVIGPFSKNIRESVEMYYQYNHPYHFDSSKFELAFNLKPTSYADGIRHMAQTVYKKQ
ncbi:NAD-dependent epimerase/dehydratase family protein [Pedobacter cryoconitis]|uniref:Nucleoside-diphosphate-sugar epimerase n=1 Tax=Pedobacter cryoconitis TaxID=188932 RepID=A0A7X0J066_9SPHI|nr:NAD-dependent epimerase/dehydratase family protein [Pedobacter cryoconitis]MBB6498082.1 nucleoside-diphosphate-sugar epimerase [Pedobacter cryoconitis]